MCLAGAVAAFWSLTQEVAEWQVRPLYCNDKFFVTEFAEFSEKIFRKNSIVRKMCNMTGILDY